MGTHRHFLCMLLADACQFLFAGHLHNQPNCVDWVVLSFLSRHPFVKLDRTRKQCVCVRIIVMVAENGIDEGVSTFIFYF